MIPEMMASLDSSVEELDGSIHTNTFTIGFLSLAALTETGSSWNAIVVNRSANGLSLVLLVGKLLLNHPPG
jgi:hypothetical protein